MNDDGLPHDIAPGHYTVERELGRGGMATVYVARDTKHGRCVALKVLRSELAASLGAERFRREITLAASLQHPHIVPVHDSGETPSGVLWFTMPLIEGESLRDRLRRQRQLSVDEAVRITCEVAHALDYAHRHGVIHRDIKPENILLVDGQPLVADFGIARPTAPSAGGDTLTATGMAIGTPTYMSPEQAAGEREVSAATDVYSLGVVLYEMLAGEPPYTGPTAQAIAAKMMTGDPPSLRRTRPSVPEALDAAIRRALSPVAADRFASTVAFAGALMTAERSAAAAAGTTTGGTPTAPRLHGWIATGLVTLSLAVLIAVGTLLMWRHRQTDPAGFAAAGLVGVAVLPFDTEGDTANAYFAAGITDEIRSKLSALGGLRLIAAASSNQYRQTTKPLDQVSRELGVPYLLTGRIQWERSGGGARRVRVSPELIQIVAGQAPVTKWQQSYDTTLADVFDVQSAVATRVADKLGVVLSPQAQTQIAARPTQNLAAYEAYLRSTALNGVDPATLRRAIAAAELAVARDSCFASAWARASVLHGRLYIQSVPTQADADAARRDADRAIALAPGASDGYYARQSYNNTVTHDLAAARAAAETAFRLAPSSSLAAGGLGVTEFAQGQWEAGLAHVRQAAALDPRSPAAAARLSAMLLYLRRYPEARAEAEIGLAASPSEVMLIGNRAASFLGEGDLAAARAALREAPPTVDRAALAVAVAHNHNTYWTAHALVALDSADRSLVLALSPATFDGDRGDWAFVRAELYWLSGDTIAGRRYAESARTTLESQLRMVPGDDYRHLYLGLVLAYLGQQAAAVNEGKRELALIQASGDAYRIPHARELLAQIYLAVGDHPDALDQLDSLLAEPYIISPAWLKIDPTWASLYGDPRFERLIAQPPLLGVADGLTDPH